MEKLTQSLYGCHFISLRVNVHIAYICIATIARAPINSCSRIAAVRIIIMVPFFIYNIHKVYIKCEVINRQGKADTIRFLTDIIID